MENLTPEQVLKKPMTKEEAEEFFGILFRGKHHIPGGEAKKFGQGWKVNAYAGIATFDFDDLTRLVFLAHDKCVRAEIVQGGPGRIGIAIWKRHGRRGYNYDHHPSINTALTNWRMKHPEPTDE